MLLIVVGAMVLAIALFVLITYNRLVRLRLACDNSWAQIEVALKLRHDLVPNLVAAVSGYAGHERATFERTAEARGAAVAAVGAGPAAQGPVEGVLAAGHRQPDRRRRGLPGPEGKRELRGPPARPRLGRGADLDHPTRLQRHRRDPEHRRRGLPAVARRRRLRLPAARRSSPPTPRSTPRRRSTSEEPAGREAIRPAADRRDRRDRDRRPRASRSCPQIPTSEKEYEITDARVSVQLQDDGSLIVHESLPFDFTGNFTRRLPRHPARRGARITDIGGPRGNGTDYRPAATRCSDPSTCPGTYGTRQMPDGLPGRLALRRRRRDEDVRPRLSRHRRRPASTTTSSTSAGPSGARQWDFWLDHLDADIAAASGVAPERGLAATALARRRRRGRRRRNASPSTACAEGEAVGPAGGLPARRDRQHRRCRGRDGRRPRRDRGRGGRARRRLRHRSTS